MRSDRKSKAKRLVRMPLPHLALKIGKAPLAAAEILILPGAEEPARAPELVTHEQANCLHAFAVERRARRRKRDADAMLQRARKEADGLLSSYMDFMQQVDVAKIDEVDEMEKLLLEEYGAAEEKVAAASKELKEALLAWRIAHQQRVRACDP